MRVFQINRGSTVERIGIIDLGSNTARLLIVDMFTEVNELTRRLVEGGSGGGGHGAVVGVPNIWANNR